MGKAFDNTKLFLSANPTAMANIVGHSLGGWQAAHLAQQINTIRCGAMDNLITLDPVGTRARNFGVSINKEFPTLTAKDYSKWVNVRAEREGIFTGGDNWIANLGGQWDPSAQNPTFNYELDASHADANGLLTSQIAGQTLSPWDLLVNHYANLPADYKFENAPQPPVRDFRK